MLFWKALVFPPLRRALTFSLLDSSDASLAKIHKATYYAGKELSMPNLAYETWVALDQLLQGWLNNLLFPDIVAHVLDMATIAET
jgi:hypothetical protein